MNELEENVRVVRRFSRLYTRVLGLLRGGLLDTPYTLTEARIIFELAQSGHSDLRTLREVLDLDAGYLSRVLGRLEEQRLLRRQRSDADARRQVIELTRKGRREFDLLDTRSADQVRDLLSRLGADGQTRLVTAMREIEAVLDPRTPPKTVVLRSPRSGDFGWVIERHGVLYAQEYGWDETFESLVARIVSEYIEHLEPDRQAAWIAEVDGQRMGCVFCMQKTKKIAQLRLLLIEPAARGLGIGTRLVDECIDFARRAGYERMTLWTNDVLEAARRIYERAGFKLVEEEEHDSFGHHLVGQNWDLVL
jgi:DNA-binding MarR family transcriptional regulator/N-acetylglutamate synthase-like GNAT family acetyltransferase